VQKAAASGSKQDAYMAKLHASEQHNAMLAAELAAIKGQMQQSHLQVDTASAAAAQPIMASPVGSPSALSPASEDEELFHARGPQPAIMASQPAAPQPAQPPARPANDNYQKRMEELMQAAPVESKPAPAPKPVQAQAGMVVHSPAVMDAVDWDCSSCTFKNESLALACTICGTQRQTSGWKCPGCTFENSRQDNCCLMCGINQNGEQAVQSSSVQSQLAPASNQKEGGDWSCAVCTFLNPEADVACQICGAKPG